MSQRPVDLARRVERRGGHAEDDLGLVGLGQAGQELQQPGGPAQADQEHAGGVGVEGAGVADPALAEDPPAAGHHVVAGHPGRLVDHRQAVDHESGPPGAGPVASAGAGPRRHRRPAGREVARGCPRSGCRLTRRVGGEAQLRGPLHPDLAGRSPPGGGSAPRPAPRLLVAERRQRGPWRGAGRVAVDGGDGEQAQPLVGVGQPLEGLGQDLAEDLVDPGRRG